ncbi:hypothetical protein Tco_0278206 [Tanacetum coccineum]
MNEENQNEKQNEKVGVEKHQDLSDANAQPLLATQILLKKSLFHLTEIKLQYNLSPRTSFRESHTQLGLQHAHNTREHYAALMPSQCTISYVPATFYMDVSDESLLISSFTSQVTRSDLAKSEAHTERRVD